MITVSWDGRVLSAEGHATTDPRVCAAVSVLAVTLYGGYGASEPVGGSFNWDSRSVIGTDVPEFILNCIRVLVRQYPLELQLIEVERHAA